MVDLAGEGIGKSKPVSLVSSLLSVSDNWPFGAVTVLAWKCYVLLRKEKTGGVLHSQLDSVTSVAAQGKLDLDHE